MEEIGNWVTAFAAMFAMHFTSFGCLLNLRSGNSWWKSGWKCFLGLPFKRLLILPSINIDSESQKVLVGEYPPLFPPRQLTQGGA